MSDPRNHPFRIIELWLALLLPVVTVIALISLAHIASSAGFTEIVERTPAMHP